MPQFSYTALTSDGTRTSGTRESIDLQTAVAALRTDNLLVLQIEEASGFSLPRLLDRLGRRSSRFSLGLLRPVGSQDIIQFFRELCLMLRAGLPLLQALEIYRNHCGKLQLARSLERIAARIEEGVSFSKAMESERKYFPVLVIKMVATGEATGELDTLLERIADQIEHKAEMRNTLLTSLTYPALVMLITVGVVAFLITHVIPKFMQVLANRNVALPASTQFLVDLSDFLDAYGMHLVGGFCGTVLMIGLVYLTSRGRFCIDRILLSIPLIGGMLRLAVMARFGKTLSILLKSGVSILDGLRLLSESVPNEAFRRHLRQAEQNVLEGKTLESSLRARFMPALLLELISVGETTGTLDLVLDKAGVFFEEKLKKRIKWMSSLFEPVMILVVGSVVGFVYISFFQVLYQMSSR